MEFGKEINTDPTEYIIDQNYNTYVGWQETSNAVVGFFNSDTVKMISTKVSELLEGVDEKNRKIVVPNNLIVDVMNGIQKSYTPPVGDINTRYNIPKESPTDYKQDMIDQTIQIIVNDVKYNLGMEQNNAKLTAWTTVYGDFNQKGLRSHAPIKIRNKRPASMQFNMNY